MPISGGDVGRGVLVGLGVFVGFGVLVAAGVSGITMLTASAVSVGGVCCAVLEAILMNEIAHMEKMQSPTTARASFPRRLDVELVDFLGRACVGGFAG